MRRSTPLVLALAFTLSLAPSLPLTGADSALAAEDTPAAPLSQEDVLAGLKSKDVGERRRAAEAALTVSGEKVVLPLVKALRDENADVRRSATLALAARQDAAARKSAANGVAARLNALEKREGESAELERIDLANALHDLAQKSSIKALMRGIDQHMTQEECAARFRAVANVPCNEAIDTLIQELASGRRRGRNNRRDAAVKALQYATGQRMKRDPDVWRTWWKEVKRGYDHEAAAASRAAGEAEKRAKRERKSKKGDGKGGEKKKRKGKKGKKQDDT